tara:strand:+ start:7005 stop:8267 length:1263 start_codon:yes stop_codon:yes gene_type:complete
MNNYRIAVIGQGYVGLPLAIEFGKKYQTIGYDIDKNRIEELKNSFDKTREASVKQIKNSIKLSFSSDIDDLKECNIFIVTVPTPIDDFKTPDLKPLENATRTIGKNLLKKDDVVIYESTVFPGCTEDFCVPILESESKLVYNKDFFCGYSPERIVPGDKENTITKIVKVTSGSNENTAKIVDILYNSVIPAGTFQASSIKVAEASKAIENAQRDLNISFVNELALIFDKIGIDTLDVIDTAASKWNFLKFKPGLVGGHCISVDPYYLVYKAENLGYYPEVILSGRRVNDNMSHFVSEKILKMLISSGKQIDDSRILILGITFKENCPDIRNSKVSEVYYDLKDYGLKVDVYDNEADKNETEREFGISLIDEISIKYDLILLAVGHDSFKKLNILKIKKDSDSLVFDLKGFLPRDIVDYRL